MIYLDTTFWLTVKSEEQCLSPVLPTIYLCLLKRLSCPRRGHLPCFAWSCTEVACRDERRQFILLLALMLGFSTIRHGGNSCQIRLLDQVYLPCCDRSFAEHGEMNSCFHHSCLGYLSAMWKALLFCTRSSNPTSWRLCHCWKSDGIEQTGSSDEYVCGNPACCSHSHCGLIPIAATGECRSAIYSPQISPMFSSYVSKRMLVEVSNWRTHQD